MTATVDELKRDPLRLIALANHGSEVLITIDGRPQAKLSAISPSTAKPKAGTLPGEVWLAPDFDEPLADFRDYQ